MDWLNQLSFVAGLKVAEVGTCENPSTLGLQGEVSKLQPRRDMDDLWQHDCSVGFTCDANVSVRTSADARKHLLLP